MARRIVRTGSWLLSLAGLTLGCAAWSCSSTDSPDDPGTTADGGSSGTPDNPGPPGSSGTAPPAGDGGSSGAVPSGPRVMVRIGNFAKPDFLDLDACFGTTEGGVTTWSGPYWRDDWAHGATWSRVTDYRAIRPGATQVRFVAQENADCNLPIVGLPDQALAAPLDAASDRDVWYSVFAHGDAHAQGAAAFHVKTWTDRASTPDTPFAIRVLTTNPDFGTIEFGTSPDPNLEGYEPRIQNVGYDTPSPYTSWESQHDTPLYFGFKIFPQGQTGGTPLIADGRSQSEATGRGSWSLFVGPGRNAGSTEWTFCSDGAEGPRLCYPCGKPSCEGL